MAYQGWNGACHHDPPRPSMSVVYSQAYPWPPVSQRCPSYNQAEVYQHGGSSFRSQPFPPPGPSRSYGNDYLRSLQTEMSNLDLDNIGHQRQRTISSPASAGSNKPLPSLPTPPPIPARPYTGTLSRADHSRYSLPAQSRSDNHVQPSRPFQTSKNAQSSPGPPRQSLPPYSSPTSTPPPRASRVSDVVTPPKTFHPSVYLTLPRPPLIQSEPRIPRPQSDPSTPRKSRATTKPNKPIIVIDSDSDSDGLPLHVTTRSPARRKRATSEQPRQTFTAKKNTLANGAVKCAGFTRKGQPCQRLVKTEAPYLSLIEPRLPGEERLSARYCKDHAGMICNVAGFYWRGGKESTGVWIDFDEFIPAELGQQTQALLRMTMESPLTDKEAPGYLYAYELRDLQNNSTSFFKVGRTDNVPRRIGEWTTRCRSHTPTLRDLFPLSTTPAIKPHFSGTNLNRLPSARLSYLPGALRQSTNPARTCPAVKRWERLVHFELADRASTDAPKEYYSLKEKCNECQAVHREVFPLANKQRVYEDVVREVICRWERFVRRICVEKE